MIEWFKQLDLPLENTPMLERDEHYDEVTYSADYLTSHKTLDEFERHYYITNNSAMHSMWSMVSELEDALKMAAAMSQ